MLAPLLTESKAHRPTSAVRAHGPQRRQRSSLPPCARDVVFQMADVAIPRRLFAVILERIRQLRHPEAVPR